jgi:hypothetical protein
MAHETNAILAINSLDRYLGVETFANSTTSALYQEYLQDPPYSSDFNIQSGGALIYGYMYKLILSQVQYQCNIPTVCTDRNDTFWIQDATTGSFYQIIIPYGFYTPDEMASVLQVLIRQTDIVNASPNFTVSYRNTNGEQGGFAFESNNDEIYSFPSVETLIDDFIITPDTAYNINRSLKAYKLLGITQSNIQPRSSQYSSTRIKWLYTDFVDIISSNLTKYQVIKDTDTSIKKQDSIVARIYLTGVGVDQQVRSTDTLGSRPFSVVQDMNSPKVMRWSRDEAVNNLDFQQRDQYGDFIFVGSEGGINTLDIYNSEFQMTLLCVEAERY